MLRRGHFHGERARPSKRGHWDSVTAIDEDGVSFSSAALGVDVTVAADAVVDLSDLLPNPDDDLGVETLVVGDAATPFNIAEAISSGNLAARSI